VSPGSGRAQRQARRKKDPVRPERRARKARPKKDPARPEGGARQARPKKDPVRPERRARQARPESRAPLDRLGANGKTRLPDRGEARLLDRIKLDARGLVPVIAQEEDGTVLMLAWANREALEATLRTRRGTYWSRSRRELWRKGDTSGHVQEVLAIKVDCDGDAVLYVVRQTGPACHLGSRSCFS